MTSRAMMAKVRELAAALDAHVAVCPGSPDVGADRVVALAFAVVAAWQCRADVDEAIGQLAAALDELEPPHVAVAASRRMESAG